MSLLDIRGAARGFNSTADLLTQTADGRDLNALWLDYQAVLADYNARRSELVAFLTYGVTEPIVEIPVIGAGADFEEASEYGVPMSIRPGVGHYSMGFPFKWYDLAARFTWQYLADATQEQVDSIQAAAVDSDNRLVFGKVMNGLFNNVNSAASIKGNNYTVYRFWNNDGVVPPPFETTTFTGSHQHYMTTGGAFEAGDLDLLIDNVAHHGYTVARGYRLVVLMNKQEVTIARAFRSYAQNNGVKDATHGDWDFIPAQGTAAMLLPQNTVLLGQQPANTLGAMEVVGSYGDVLIVQNGYIPAGYMVAFATGGVDNLNNPLGIRQHTNETLQGMRLVKGPNPDYPIIDSYYVRGFGIGVRQRGAAAVMQVTAGAYAIPAAYAS